MTKRAFTLDNILDKIIIKGFILKQGKLGSS